MRHILEQNDKYSCAIAPQDAAFGATASGWYDMTAYGIGAFVVQAGADTDDVACQVWQAKTAAGGTPIVMTNGPQSGAVTLTGDGSTAQCDVIEFTDRDLNVASLYTHVKIVMTVSGSGTCQISSVLDRGNCRHANSTMPT